MSRKVVTETVEKRGGVQTKTTTITCSKEDFDSAFQKLNLDPDKFKSGGTSVTRQIVYTNSAGVREVLEETVETYGSKADAPPSKTAVIADQEQKKSKSLSEKLGFGKSAKLPEVKSNGIASKTRTKSQEGKGDKFEEDCLKKHNEYRRKHGVSDLILSNEMNAYAKEWADHLAATDSFEHRTERKYGENIFMKWSSDPNHTVTGDEAVDSWYSEIKDFVFGQEPRSLKSGHFTQVIWKESKSLGVAWSRSKSGKVLVVANYDPPGNFVGKFAENVPAPKK